MGSIFGMSNVIVVTSGKGGVGKTTISAQLGISFAKLDKKVLLVELDVGLRGLDIMLGVEDKVVYDLGDLLNNECELSQAMTKIGEKDLNLISAPADVTKIIDATKFIELINEIKSDFDYVIIDTPAGLGVSLAIAQVLGDLNLVVTTPDNVCKRDGARLVSLLRQMSKGEIRLIINRVDKKLLKKQDVKDLDQVIDQVGARLIGVIPNCGDIIVWTSNGEWDLGENIIVKIFLSIAKRIMGENIPLNIK
jgi:septum site-determining protein MinD